MHTASTVRPCDSKSRLAHCRASRRGSRSGKLARQIVPNRTRCVRAAMADSVTSASARGLDSRLSPTQMPSKYPDASAVWAAVSRSSSVPHPKRIARVDRLRPNCARIGCRIGSLQDCESPVPYTGIKFTHKVSIRHDMSAQTTRPPYEE
jgi:hypothetical protein